MTEGTTPTPKTPCYSPQQSCGLPEPQPLCLYLCGGTDRVCLRSNYLKGVGGFREQNPRDNKIGSRRRCRGSTWEARRGRQARQLVRGKFCLWPNVSEALGPVPLSPSRWQCVNSDGSGSLDENLAGCRAGRGSSHIGVIYPSLESATLRVLC